MPVVREAVRSLGASRVEHRLHDRLAIGPPSVPPAISSRAVALDWTSTATATFGSSAGANEANQAYGGRESVDSAVPVLPATRTPGIAAA